MAIERDQLIDDWKIENNSQSKGMDKVRNGLINGVSFYF